MLQIFPMDPQKEKAPMPDKKPEERKSDRLMDRREAFNPIEHKKFSAWIIKLNAEITKLKLNK